MATWESYTLPTSAVSGKNSTDDIFTAAYDSGTIPASDPRLIEAKKLVRRRIVSTYGNWAVEAGGAESLLQQANEEDALQELVDDALAEAYLYYYYDSNFTERGDRWFESRQQANENVTEAVQALMSVAPATLGLAQSGGRQTSGVRSSVLGISAGGS